MKRPTFLDRSPLGIPNYLAIALLATMLLALVPRGARRALDTNTNKVEDWLPAGYSESVDLAWFRSQFGSEAFVLASWEGCTLGNTEKLDLLAEKLSDQPLSAEIAQAADVAPHADRRLFTRVVTGPQMIERLAQRPARLPRAEAIARLEGALVGPAEPRENLAATDHQAYDDSRTTCLVAYLGPHAMANNRTMRLAIDRLTEVATTECGIAIADLHLGGPPVDNVAIDVEGERTLRTLAGLSGLVGLVLAYACFRSVKLTGMVLLTATFAAAASLALVFYFGAFEVLVLGAKSPRLGKLDAILMSMPAVVYVLSLSGAIHLVNYYRDARASAGRRGAVERAVRMAWMPCALAAFTTAIGLASLGSSDILPIEKFGVFSAIGVLAALGLLFSLVPVVLHRFAPADRADTSLESSATLPGWARSIAEAICRRHAWVAGGAGAIMLLLALGLPRIESSVQLLKLLDSESDLVQDYAWLEAHLGNLVPMEVVITIPPELRRGEDEHPEASGQHYAMTTFERLLLAERVGRRIEAIDSVSRVLDAATFAPADYETLSPSNRRTHDYVMSRAIDDNRGELSEYLRWEPTREGVSTSDACELWRASARIAALEDIDYGQFVDELRLAVEPVLGVYRQRSRLVAALSERERHLAGARICLVLPAEVSSSDALFAKLLREAGVSLHIDGRQGRLWTTNLEELISADGSTRQRLASQDAVVALDRGVAERISRMGVHGLPLVNLAATAKPQADASLAAIYTGVVPLVY
ncbi:MAG: MMPL family transporter, partial [Aeoliella sp.]